MPILGRLAAGRAEGSSGGLPPGSGTAGRAALTARAVAQLALVALTLTLAGATVARAGWVHVETGPPGSQIYALAQGNAGEIGVATDQGAALFDGIRWLPALPPTTGTFVRCLAQDTARAWWFGTPSGLARLVDAEWRVFDQDDGLPSAQVNALLEDRTGRFWAGTPAGLARRNADGETWDPTWTSSLVFPEVRVLFEDSRQRLWVGTSEGVSVADPTRTQWQSYSSSNSGLARDSVFSIGEDRAGGLWFGTHQGAFRLDPSGVWAEYGFAHGVPAGDLNAIVRDSLGGLWLGGATGISRFDGRTFQPVSGPPGGNFGPIFSMLVDDPGHLWVGTMLFGLYRHEGVSLTDFVAAGGTCLQDVTANVPVDRSVLASGCLSDVLQDVRGELWVATRDSGLSRLGTNGRWTHVRARDGRIVSDAVTVLFEDGARRLWTGTADRGISSLDSTRSIVVVFDTQSGLPSDHILSLHADHAGALWVGTDAGVAYQAGAGWTVPSFAGVAGPVRVQQILEDGAHVVWLRTDAGLWSVSPAREAPVRHTTSDGLPDDAVNALALGPAGEVWVGSDHGIAARDGSAWSRTEAAVYGGGRAISLQFDREQRLWVGRSTGASYLDGAAWRNFTDVELGASDIRQVLQDVRGQVWIASPTGLGYWNGSEWRQLGRLTGLASSDVREILEDSQSRLWTIGDHGLTRVIPDRTSPQTIFRLPQAAVTTSRTLSFAFGAAYDETADLEYEAYWDGARVQDWSATSSHQQEDVPDGWHTFAVRSRDWYRNEDPSAATVTFEVDATPPQAVLSSPLFRAPVQGEVAIVGSVTDARYRSHRLEVRPLGSAAWLTIAAGDSAVTLDTLARWDSRSAPDGDHEIRLSVLDELGLVGTALVQVIVDNVAPFADVTSPVRVRAAEGGDVFTTGSEVHAYFPPFAFDADATVQIEPDAEAGGPETLPDGAERVGPAWLLAWSEANLKSAGTLDMLAPPSEARPLAIYREDAPGTWRRLGGTPPAGGGRHSVGLQAPGRHALFAGGTTVPSAALSGVTLVPRAFSPHGTFGSRELSIGFTLGRAASVSVKVHDRAGRLLRVVADGLGMPAGEGVLRWDGRDRDGGTVPAGLYLVTIEASGERETRTLAVVR